MTYYAYQDVCLADHGGKLPEGAVPVDAPFDPLVLLVAREMRRRPPASFEVRSERDWSIPDPEAPPELMSPMRPM